MLATLGSISKQKIFLLSGNWALTASWQQDIAAYHKILIGQTVCHCVIIITILIIITITISITVFLLLTIIIIITTLLIITRSWLAFSRKTEVEWSWRHIALFAGLQSSGSVVLSRF